MTKKRGHSSQIVVRCSSPSAWRDVLLGAGAPFGGDRALEAVPRLQALPVGRDIRPEILCQSDIVGQPQRIADHDVGGGEPVGAERFRFAGCGLYRAQPAEKPFGVVADDLRIAPFFRLKLAVAQHQGLREGQRRIAELLQFDNVLKAGSSAPTISGVGPYRVPR